MKPTILKILISLVVLIHLGGNVWHGYAHAILEIDLPNLKTAFVAIVIVIVPVLGAILTWTRFPFAGCCLVGASMFGSVLFSVYHHYVLISIDNVEHLPPGAPEAHAHFSNSAESIALGALAGVVLGFYAVGKLSTKD